MASWLMRWVWVSDGSWLSSYDVVWYFVGVCVVTGEITYIYTVLHMYVSM